MGAQIINSLSQTLLLLFDLEIDQLHVLIPHKTQNVTTC
jgi:hypothetical protein